MREGLDSLAEQASYIWFTKEIDAQLAPGRVELPPKDPATLRTTLRQGDATADAEGAFPIPSIRRPSASSVGGGGSPSETDLGHKP